MDLAEFLISQVIGVGLVFARLGSAMAFLPGFGESSIPLRFRLLFALALSGALYPMVPLGPLAISAPLQLLPILAIEITLGVWIGTTARILLSALQFAGYQIGLVSGLSNAFAPDTGTFQGSTLIASALMMAGVALIFATNLHHLMIQALLMSYEVFPPGQILLGDLAQQTVRAVGKSFYIGLALTAPFYILGLLLNLGMGLANRMMPSLPVFFVAAPVLIFAGLVVLVMAGPAMLDRMMDLLAEWFGTLTL